MSLMLLYWRIKNIRSKYALWLRGVRHMNASEKKVDYDLTQEKIFDIYKKDRFLFILEALFANFITIIIGGAFIAKLSTSLGITDAVTGIISAISSLGCASQLVCLFLIGLQLAGRRFLCSVKIVGLSF